MTYLHKLAKRLALVPAIVASTLSILAACTEGTSHDYLGPDPNKPNSSSSYIGLSITPHDPQLVQGDSIRLEARGWLSSGQSALATVSWSGSGVTGAGWFRAMSVGSFRVRAVSTANAALSDSVLITVFPPAGIARIDVTPQAAQLPAGSRQQFSAVALMGDGSRMYPTVQWTATGGSISPTGLFTASSEPGGYTVSALIGDGALRGQTSGVVDPPVLTRLALDQPGLMMESGGSHQFVPSALWSDGSSTLPALAWTATGGTVSPSGVYTAGGAPGSYRVIASSAQHGKADTSNVTILPRVVGLRLTPLTALLAMEATQVVTALALRSDGTEGPIGVQWSAQGGSMTLGGAYTAGTTAGTFPVVGTLTSLGGEVLSDTAFFQVGAEEDEATAAPLFVVPDTVLLVGASARFRVVSGGSSTVPAVTWSATGGSIDNSGLYTAGVVPGSYRVIAKKKNGGKADTAQVSVMAAPSIQVTGFTVTPSSDIIGAGQARQFSATLSWNDGQVHPADISWVSAGGTITQNGLYTAGTVAGSFLVIATCGCGAADTASVTIPAGTSAPVTLTEIVLSPPAIQLAPGGSQIFVAVGRWSDGVTAPTPVSFTAEGGSITAAGLYIAGDVPGSYRVIARQAGGNLADTAMVTIPGETATLTQLVLNPSAVTVPQGATQAFVVSALWSDGSTTVPPVSFSATGGTVSNDGVYTAGTTAGIFRLIVSHTGGTRADTSFITIPAGVTLTQLVLNPSAVTLGAGEARQFIPSGSWTDGSTLAPTVTYSATGGTISAAGMYVAGSTAGTFRVIAAHTGGTLADTSVVTIASAPPPPTGFAGDRVVFPNEEIGFIIGPQIKAGAATPWPWFDENLVAKGLVHGAAFPASPAAEPISADHYYGRNYYDLGLVLYTAYYRTGNTTLLEYARKVTDSWWLSYPNGGANVSNVESTGPTPRGSSLGGLMLRALDGRPEMWPWITAYVRTFQYMWLGRFLTASELQYGVRDGGFMLTYTAWLAKVHPDPAVRAEMRQKALDAATKYYARLQHPDGGWYWEFTPEWVPQGGDMYASQPFQVGLMLEGMVSIHQLTGDPTVAQSITRAADWLYATAFEKQAVTNLTGVNWRAMKYLVYRTNPTINNYTDALRYNQPDGAIRDQRQLNPDTIHAFGYAFLLTGDPKYLTWGDDIFAATFGHGRGPGADAYWGLADFREKEFNQSYRSAGRYLARRLGF